ncbi:MULTISPECIES: class I SAM-dependent methyltransferase [Microbacterium]|uniref:class I SAM-dependent methyltransferase n=1 Tax=Microbacterium TaxID=33882 RepID=UPI00168B77D2|nr:MULTISPECIES: class I SAM-dependent methyltransferase [Microbacterium]QOC25145.1 class I SAM-dependent methyltransferase [Microbacterium hominis]QYF98597.1 class I SAM-dependent methyltransferase [Microbacterium sp. PAMC21962]
MATRDEMATSFGAAVGEYERGRPSYPAEAVAWLIAPAGLRPRVADVGAGTGKLTEALRRAGAEVVAVEPDAAMRDAFRRSLPGVEVRAGAAEATGLADGSVDAVVFGQAWHWVRVPEASAEAARVLRPGGVIGLIWNIRDESVSWVARLGAAMKGSHAEELLAGEGPTVAAPFGTLEHESWRWSRAVTRDEVLAMVRSRSYVITAPAEERARIEQEVAALLDEIGAVGDARVELPYVTHGFRAVAG